MVSTLREVVRLAGFEAVPELVHVADALTSLRRDDATLIFIDARRAPSPFTLAKAVRRLRRSRFVLTASSVTPEMLQSAVGAGIHGVFTTGVPVQEAALALARIWRGERQLRFQCARSRAYVPPSPENADFDAAWMFGPAV